MVTGWNIHRLCVVIGITLHKTAQSRKMCILGQLHNLRVLNVCLAGFALPTVFHLPLGFAPFFSFSLLGFRSFKMFVCCTKIIHYHLWNKMWLKHGMGINCTKNGNCKSPWCSLAKYHFFKSIASTVRESIEFCVISDFEINSNPSFTIMPFRNKCWNLVCATHWILPLME